MNEHLAEKLVRPAGRTAENSFLAIVTSSTADGTNRYLYTLKKLKKTALGYGGWALKTVGDPEENVVITARNTLEDVNSGSGTLGNGVAVSHLDTSDYTFTLSAAPAGAIVRVYRVQTSVLTWVEATTTEEGEVIPAHWKVEFEYWFSYANGVDGTCD